MGKNLLDENLKRERDKKISDFIVKQKQPYWFKKKYATIRAKEFYDEATSRGYNVHVSVGGLDSITLFMFLRSIGIDAVGISVSNLEDVTIQRVHKQLGITRIPPLKDKNGKPYNKTRIIQEFGFPVLSKEIASKIELLQNQLEKRPHRFDRLHETNMKEWDYWMNKCCVDEQGNKYGWGKVLEYIGISWNWNGNKMVDLDGQMKIF